MFSETIVSCCVKKQWRPAQNNLLTRNTKIIEQNILYETIR